MATIKQRLLGHTGLPVSALGFGGAPIGFTSPGHEEAHVALVRRALELGVTFLDTAPDYRGSEAIIGEALRGWPGRVVLATKVGRRQTPTPSGWAVSEDWSEDGALRSVEGSLTALGVDCLDLVQLHSPPMWALESGAALRGLERAREAGLARHLGLSADGVEARRALEIGAFETLQLSYSLLQQEPGENLVRIAHERGVGVIVKQPIANGVLGLQTRPEHPDWAQKWEAARRMSPADLGPVSERQALALRWLLADRRVSTAIVGTARVEHLEANVAATSGPPLEPGRVERLRRTYQAAVGGAGA